MTKVKLNLGFFNFKRRTIYVSTITRRTNTRNSKMIATLIKDEIHHFKEDMGLDTPFLNKKQTCHYLGISHNTLDIWIAMGLPYIRVGKSIRFSKESINQWMTRLEISA